MRSERNSGRFVELERWNPVLGTYVGFICITMVLVWKSMLPAKGVHPALVLSKAL